VSPVKYEQGFYIPEDDILHSHLRENLKSYTVIYSLPHFSVDLPLLQFAAYILPLTFLVMHYTLESEY
jgi:hypothetical protein